MGVSGKAASAWKLFKTTKKAYSYYKIVKGALDEDTRSGALFKGGIKVTMDVAKKFLGSTIKWHPYYTYHKAHFAALAEALSAMDMKTMAVDAFNRAVNAADSTSSVTSVLETFTHRRNALAWSWSFTLAEPINIRARSRTNPAAAAIEMKNAGFTPDTLNAYIADNLYDWQATWSELCQDSLELFLMVDAETRVAEAAMARYNEKIKKLTHGKSTIGRVAGYSAEQQRQWEMYDRMTQPAKPDKPEQAVLNPVGYSRKQRDAADAMARGLAQACDLALSDAVFAPDALLTKLDFASMTPAAP